MTNIEQEFFETFGIEPITYCKHFKYVKSKCDKLNSESGCTDCIGKYSEYPKITDRVLLQLIRIMNIYQEKSLIYGQTMNELKYDILNRCILMHKKGLGIKSEIQSLFREEGK